MKHIFPSFLLVLLLGLTACGDNCLVKKSVLTFLKNALTNL